jgi:hypothetical protein
MAKDIHDNSRESYREQEQRGFAESFRRAIFNELLRSSVPMTDRELMQALNQQDPNNIRPEITRLKQAGLIREAGKVRCIWSGRLVRTTEPTGADYRPRGAPADPDPPELCDRVQKELF